MNMLCVIMVITCGSIPLAFNTEVDGKLIDESRTKYYVDFTESKTLERYCSNIGKRIVNKDDCIKLEGGNK